MYKVIITEKALTKIKNYISTYREYHQELFLDSGIWSEDNIISEYRKESQYRYQEIRILSQEKLSNSVISYQGNQAIIRWRSKILLVTFRDDKETRIIIDLEIR